MIIIINNKDNNNKNKVRALTIKLKCEHRIEHCLEYLIFAFFLFMLKIYLNILRILN